jgi:hypothetical protein
MPWQKASFVHLKPNGLITTSTLAGQRPQVAFFTTWKSFTIEKGPKALVGNKGYRMYLRLAKDSARIDPSKIKAEALFDGKWVLTTNTNLPADQVALKYKEL